MTSEALPTHDETPRSVRLAQAFPTAVYGTLLLVSLCTGVATLFAEHGSLGATSAATAALSAAGFVLHDRPRVLSKHWEDLDWDPDMQALAEQGLVEYGSEATARWTIREKTHKKGRFPIVRFILRANPSSSWAEAEVHFFVTPKGDITVTVDIQRDAVDHGVEIAVIIQ